MAINKLMVMLPVMLAARKLDGEDPKIVFALRCTYSAIHTIIVLMCVYMFQRAQSYSNSPDGRRVVYIPSPPVVGLPTSF